MKEVISQLKELEGKIWEIEKAAQFDECLQPINANEEKRRFFENSKKREYNPTFFYQPLQPDIQPALDQLESIEEKLEYLPANGLVLAYKEVVHLLKRDLMLFSNRNSPQFNQNLTAMYGQPPQELYQGALELLNNEEFLTPKNNAENLSQIRVPSICEDSINIFVGPSGEKTIPPEKLAQQLSGQLNQYSLKWNIEITDQVAAKVSTNSFEKLIKINRNTKFSYHELERLKVHEVGTHILRYENGYLQPLQLFKYGSPNCIDTEEGLAMVVEEETGNLPLGILREYAGRVFAAYHATKSSFWEVFLQLTKWFSQEDAYRITLRAKRGLLKTEEKGGYTKDFSYLQGYQKVKTYLKAGGTFNGLFLGKIKVEDMEWVQSLLKENLLIVAKYLPIELYLRG